MTPTSEENLVQIIDNHEGLGSTNDFVRYKAVLWRRTGRWSSAMRFPGDEVGEDVEEIEWVRTAFGDTPEEARINLGECSLVV